MGRCRAGETVRSQISKDLSNQSDWRLYPKLEVCLSESGQTSNQSECRFYEFHRALLSLGHFPILRQMISMKGLSMDVIPKGNLKVCSQVVASIPGRSAWFISRVIWRHFGRRC